MKFLSTNSRPFFWPPETFSSLGFLVTHFNPRIMWNRICFIKVRSGKSKSADSGAKKSFLLARRMSEIFLFHSNIEQLVIFLSNCTSLRHQCPTYFLSLSGLKIIPFLSPQNFPHTTRNVWVRLRRGWRYSWWSLFKKFIDASRSFTLVEAR